MKTITQPINKCGGKKSGCVADIILPYGVAPKRVTDNAASQSEASEKSTKTSK